MTGENALADRQRLALPVSQAQGITVHGTVGPGRQIQAGNQRLGQHPPLGLRQSNLLGFDDGRGLSQFQ
ncbi:hypothetical protein D3C79_666430 [compost metagenome]